MHSAFPSFCRIKILLLLLSSFLTVSLQAAELPTGQTTPEGVACDAVMAYIHRDSKAWLATLVRPIYGEEGNKTYAEFKQRMAANSDKDKAVKIADPARIVKCFKARPFTANGPTSAAYAIGNFTGNLFVDVVVEITPGNLKRLRYHVLQDQDQKWYFEPRPDLAPMFSMGLNQEPESTEVLYEAKPQNEGK